MSICKKSVLVLITFLMSTWTYASSATVSPKPYVLFSIRSFPITNGMLYTWIISLAILVFIRWLIGKPKWVPGKGQLVVETILSSIYEVVTPIVGKNVAKAAFPLLIGFFIYIFSFIMI